MKYMSSAFCRKESGLKRSSYVAVNAFESLLQTVAIQCRVGKNVIPICCENCHNENISTLCGQMTDVF